MASPPVLLALATAAAAIAPGPGLYEAQLCVATSAAPASCGPAAADLQPTGLLRVQISDIVYHLQLKAGQVEVVLMHGGMQLDEFSAPYTWLGNSLRFADAQKNARYEVKLGERKTDAK